MKKINSRLILASLAMLLGFAANLNGQFVVNGKTYKSLRPTKAQVASVEEGIATVKEQIQSQSESKLIFGNIKVVENRVASISEDFPRNKRIPVWNETIQQLKTETEGIRKQEMANAQAAKEQKAALNKVASSMSQNRVRYNMDNFKKNPSLRYGEGLVSGYSELLEALQTYRKTYPDDNDSETMLKAEKVSSYVEGEFMDVLKEELVSQRRKDALFIQKERAEDPEAALNVLSKRSKFGNRLVRVFPGDDTFQGYQQEDKTLTSELETYISSGAHETFLVDQVKIPISVGKDDEVEKHIRELMTASGYEVVVVSFQDAEFQIESNKYGIPENAYKEVAIGAKKDGQCWHVPGYYNRAYTGAGTFLIKGGLDLEDPEQMNCINLK